MASIDDLRQELLRLDGRSYPAYKDLCGFSAHQNGLTLHFDHIQGDPFAAPSRLRVRLAAAEARFPDWATSPEPRRLALEHELARHFAESCAALRSRAGSSGSGGSGGSGKSGLLDLDSPGQEVLEQTAVRWLGDAVEARFRCGLPARGRRILGRAAAELLCEHLPAVVDRSLRHDALPEEDLRRAVESAEDAAALRDQLRPRGLVAFVANGAVLPRRSGVDQRPLGPDRARPFTSPPGLEVTLDTPNRGPVSGMGLPEGVTLIVGGGFHGKSTLLNALERGVYLHRAGDGREFVVADPDTVKIRAEDGRSVVSVDISPFIDNLPDGSDTRRFSTANASGSTSQAAHIVEALEAGARVLLIDEDIAATNFMIRDRRMQELVAPEKEPITPFVAKVRALYEERGISSILVIGGSGDYFGVADRVIAMEAYEAREVTAEARAIAERHSADLAAVVPGFPSPGPRVPDPRSLDPSRGRRDASVKARDLDTIEFGHETIDLSAVAQLVHPSQTRAVAVALLLAWQRGILDGTRPVGEILDEITRLELDQIAPGRRGDLAGFRRHELAAALNRLRALRVSAGEPAG